MEPVELENASILLPEFSPTLIKIPPFFESFERRTKFEN